MSAAGNGQFVQQLREFLGKSEGNKYDKAAYIYDMIMEAENPEAAFGYFLDSANDIVSSNVEKISVSFSEEQIKNYDKEYSNLIDGILNKLIVKHCTKEEFYLALWDNIIRSDSLFEKKEAKVYALGRIWSDERIPYFPMDAGLKMSEEKFQRIIEDNQKLIQEINFILNCRHEQRTECSSLLLNVLDRCSDEKDKTVIMASILALMERRVLLQLANNRK